MCFDHDGYPEFSEDRVLTAKKEHRCTDCRSVIAKGEQYYRHAGKCDGDFYVSKECRRCCYDRNRIVEMELSEGCRWHEAQPPLDWLGDILSERGMKRTRPEEVPESFRVGDSPKEPPKAVSATEFDPNSQFAIEGC